jgi:hypothetical protein
MQEPVSKAGPRSGDVVAAIDVWTQPRASTPH